MNILIGGGRYVAISKANIHRILVFDTETTGFKPGSICQLSYLIINGNDISSDNYYFKVDYIEPGAQNIHGLNTDNLIQLSNGRIFKDSFHKIEEDFSKADLLISHNFNFDLKFMKAEFHKCNSCFRYNKSLCTMRYFTSICKIPRYNGPGYKWPNLDELVRFFGIKNEDIIKNTNKLFVTENIDYHDARFDVVATYLCLKEAMYKGLFRIKGYGL